MLAALRSVQLGEEDSCRQSCCRFLLRTGTSGRARRGQIPLPFSNALRFVATNQAPAGQTIEWDTPKSHRRSSMEHSDVPESHPGKAGASSGWFGVVAPDAGETFRRFRMTALEGKATHLDASGSHHWTPGGHSDISG